MPAGMAVVRGSSPLTRGKRCRRTQAACREGLIPAHAGKTASAPPPAWTSWAHPRSRGENGRWTTAPSRWPGSSPLTRGKQPGQHGSASLLGLIPAHAGKTSSVSSGGAQVGAHPRSRGENMVARVGLLVSVGSSPLTRGKPCIVCSIAIWLGLIPAHAGKTQPIQLPPELHQAHPRSRGENGGCTTSSQRKAGSSPLTRGKLAGAVAVCEPVGLIPAVKSCGVV